MHSRSGRTTLLFWRVILPQRHCPARPGPASIPATNQRHKSSQPPRERARFGLGPVRRLSFVDVINVCLVAPVAGLGVSARAWRCRHNTHRNLRLQSREGATMSGDEPERPGASMAGDGVVSGRDGAGAEDRGGVRALPVDGPASHGAHPRMDDDGEEDEPGHLSSDADSMGKSRTAPLSL